MDVVNLSGIWLNFPLVAPVPVVPVPPRGGAGGLNPLLKICLEDEKEKHKEFCEELARKFFEEERRKRKLKQFKDKVGPIDGLEKRTTEKEAGKEFSRKEELRALRKRIDELKAELSESRKDRAADRKEVRKLKKEIRRYKMVMRGMFREAVQPKTPFELMPPVEIVPTDEPVDLLSQSLESERQNVSRAIGEGIPWFASALIALIVTYFAVPDRLSILKVLGYGGAVLLGAVGVSKTLGVVEEKK